MNLRYILAIFLICGLCSCIVTAPRYSTVEKVLTLKTGMTKDQVEQTLGVSPYYAKSITDSNCIMLYKYRLTDRSTLPFILGPTNGKSIHGKYVNLVVTYDSCRVASSYETNQDDDRTTVETNKLDINKVITFLTITLPIALIFAETNFGIK